MFRPYTSVRLINLISKTMEPTFLLVALSLKPIASSGKESESSKTRAVRLITLTRIYLGEDKWPLLSGAHAHTAAQFLPFSKEELTGDLETVNVDVARAVDFAPVVPPMHDKRLRCNVSLMLKAC